MLYFFKELDSTDNDSGNFEENVTTTDNMTLNFETVGDMNA